MSKFISDSLIILLIIVIIYLVKITKNLSKLFLSILIFTGVLIGIALLHVISTIFGPSVLTSEIIKITIPLIASIIAAGSVVIATYNTVNGEKASKKKTTFEMINLTRDIIEKGDILNKSKEIITEIDNKLKSTDFKIDVLVNNGAREFYTFLRKDDSKDLKYIVDRLEKCFYFKPETIFFIQKNELLKRLKSNDIRDQRTLWVNMNQIAGASAIKYNILYKSSSYILNKSILEKELIKSTFYKDSLLKNERKIVDNLLRKHSEIKYEELPIQYHEVYRVCNVILENHYEEIGHFFRTVHRTLKMINSYYEKNSAEYREQVGMLRAQIPNQIALLMFYNAVYSEKGRGMCRELLASNFFGDVDDFYFGNNKILRSEHFLNNDRFLNNQDAHIASKLFTFNDDSKKIYDSLLNMEKSVIPIGTENNDKIVEEIFTRYLFNKEKLVIDKLIKEFNVIPKKYEEFKVFN